MSTLIKNNIVGVDIIEVSRFVQMKNKKVFLKTAFSQREIEESLKKVSINQSLAARFCAKEAIQKTISERLVFNEIEITNTQNGKPVVTFLNPAIKKKYDCQISLSHTRELAIAVCLTTSI